MADQAISLSKYDQNWSWMFQDEKLKNQIADTHQSIDANYGGCLC